MRGQQSDCEAALERRLEHTLELFRGIPSSSLCVLPGASHSVLMEKPSLFNEIILDFLAESER